MHDLTKEHSRVSVERLTSGPTTPIAPHPALAARATAASDQLAHLARLQQFLAWIIPATFSFAALEGVAFISLRDLATGITTVVIVAFGCLALLARRYARQGRADAAVASLCAGLLGSALIVAPVQPLFIPTLVLVPLVAVAVALPFSSGRRLLYLIIICWLTATTVAVLGEVIWPPPRPPAWFTSVLRISSLTTAVGLVLLLLWQHSTRLVDTLARTRAAEERYELAAQGANDGLWDWDLRTNQVYFSPRWKAMLGCAEDAIGTSPDEWFSRVHPDDLVRVKAELAIHIDGLISHFESEHRMRDAEGRYRWVLSRGQAVYDRAGTATRLAGSQTDITSRKQAEAALVQERQFLRQIIETAPVAIAMFDTEMRYIAHSVKWLTDNQLPDASLVGQSHYAVFPNLPERWKEDHRRALAGETLSSAEEPYQRDDGSTGYTRWALTPWYAAPGVVGGIVLTTDQVDVLIHAREAAIEAARVKSEFLATMSHEIRTPMNGIIGMSELLLHTPLTPEQRDYAGIIHDSSNVLLRIINDILDFSKIEAGMFELDPIDFAPRQVVEGVVEMLRARAREKGIALVVGVTPAVPSQVHGDADRLRQVLLNLIGNAVKFTERGEVEVRVTVAAETPSGVTLQFTVRDTGIGISPEVRERLFHPFMQADSSTTRKYGGTGLGLAISKQLVELMGGTIGVESVEGLGSTFWCTVPLARSTAAEPPRRSPDVAMAPTRGPAAPDQANRILVAEDNPVNQKLALLQLKALGYAADVVPNGQAAVAAMAAQCYALVLMDCHMPEMDGFAATAAIRAEETRGGGGRVPIIAMTANAMEGDRDRCLQAGMDDYLAKPVKVEALRSLIARWLPPGEEGAPPAQAVDCPAQPVLDRAVLAELHRLQMPGEPSVIDEVTAIFIGDMIAGIAGMRAAVAHGDVAALQQTAHRCRGSSAQLGAMRLADLCASVEVLGGAGALTAAMQVLAQIDVEFTRVREALNHESTATPDE